MDVGGRTKGEVGFVLDMKRCTIDVKGWSNSKLVLGVNQEAQKAWVHGTISYTLYTQDRWGGSLGRSKRCAMKVEWCK